MTASCASLFEDQSVIMVEFIFCNIFATYHQSQDLLIFKFKIFFLNITTNLKKNFVLVHSFNSRICVSG